MSRPSPRQMCRRTKLSETLILGSVAALFIVDKTFHPPLAVILAGLVVIVVAGALLFRWGTGHR